MTEPTYVPAKITDVDRETSDMLTDYDKDQMCADIRVAGARIAELKAKLAALGELAGRFERDASIANVAKDGWRKRAEAAENTLVELVREVREWYEGSRPVTLHDILAKFEAKP